MYLINNIYMIYNIDNIILIGKVCTGSSNNNNVFLKTIQIYINILGVGID